VSLVLLFCVSFGFTAKADVVYTVETSCGVIYTVYVSGNPTTQDLINIALELEAEACEDTEVEDFVEIND
jgi:hypothetical protein